MKKLLLTAVAAGALVGGASVASAAIIDFTDTSAYTIEQSPTSASGVIDGITWTVTPSAGPMTYTTPGPGAGNIEPLKGDNDGIGIIDDELSTTESVTQYVTLSFSTEVFLTGVGFLDLFAAVNGQSNEVALLYAGSDPTTGTLLEEFEAMEAFQDNFGFMATGTSADYRGSVFTFAAALSNDNVGVADYALAGVQIAPVPLPAGVLLLGTALGGLGLMRRRKAKAA